MLIIDAKRSFSMKTLIAMLALAPLGVYAGNANAYIDKSRIHKTHGYGSKWRPTPAVRHEQLAPLTAKGGPLRDCVHVAFPQCSDNEVK